MAATRFIYFASILSAVTGRRTLLTFCESGFVPELIDYPPALSYCSANFPVDASAFPVSEDVATVTTTLTVPGGGDVTVTETLIGSTALSSGSTLTVTRFSTVTDDTAQTIIVTESPVARKRDAEIVRPKRKRTACHEISTESTYSAKETNAVDPSSTYGDHSGNGGSNGGSGAYDVSQSSGYSNYGDGSYNSDEDDGYDPYTSDGYDNSGYGESSDGTAYAVLNEPTGYDGDYEPYRLSPTYHISIGLTSPTITSAPTSTATVDPADALSRLQKLDEVLQAAICECVEDPHITTTKTVTATISEPALSSPATITIVATETSASAPDVIVTSTVFTTTTAGPVQTCIADATSNILVNGGFDDYGPGTATSDPVTTPWKIDFDDGFGVNFFSHSDLAQTAPNYAVFPADNSGRKFLLFQNLTNVDTTIPYTVSFWYQPFAFNPNSWPGNPQGACHFAVTWGDVLIFKKDFVHADADQTWIHFNSPVSVNQAASTATFLFHMVCDQAWLGDGTAVLYLDSAAIYPSNSLDCSL